MGAGKDDGRRGAWLGAVAFVALSSAAVALLQLGSVGPADPPSDGGDELDAGWPRRDAASPNATALGVVRAATRDSLEPFASPAELHDYEVRLSEAVAIQMAADPEYRFRHVQAWDGPPPHIPTRDMQIDAVVGDHLLVLRTGRLHSLRLGVPGELTLVSTIEAPRNEAELFVHQDRIAVLAREGYDFQLALFAIDSEGRLSHVTTLSMPGAVAEYPPRTPIARRLVGSTLLFHMPIDFTQRTDYGVPARLRIALPRVRIDGGEPQELAALEQITAPIQVVLEPILHTLVACDLSSEPFACTARGILAPDAGAPHVSESALYVWAGDDDWTLTGFENTSFGSVLYRIPLDSREPLGAIRTRAITSFVRIHERDGDVTLLLGEPWGDWAPEVSGDSFALMRQPVSDFTADANHAPPHAFRALPSPPRSDNTRVAFVGDHVLYGSRDSAYLLAYRHTREGEATMLQLGHGVLGIGAWGDRALAIGPAFDDDRLRLTAIALDGRATVEASAVFGQELDGGHSFFRTSPDGTTVAAPVQGRRVAFMSDIFSALGALSGLVSHDDCFVSPPFADAVPLFHRGRSFALLGCEIIEARFAGEQMTVLAHTSLDPESELRPNASGD